jgi:hypothetical protein
LHRLLVLMASCAPVLLTRLACTTGAYTTAV